MATIVLVSQSPRRKQILEEAGITPKIVKVNTEEFIDPNLGVEEAVIRVARSKVEAFLGSQSVKDSFVFLGADTIVVLENEILGKPKSDQDAENTLLKLSGSSHQVITGYAIYLSEKNQWIEGFETTKVIFKKLTRDQIREYVRTGEPMDKAGSYGIQGMGGGFVEKFEGDFLNVVGLPIGKIRDELKRYGVNL